jgi:hypothetical protein
MKESAMAKKQDEPKAGDAPQTVKMKRDPEFFPAPHTADVHPDEVDNWKKRDWVVAE